MKPSELANMFVHPVSPEQERSAPDIGGYGSNGVTLRQLYAGLALQGYAAADSKGLPDPDRVAALAVRAADCLIAELALAKPVQP